MSEEMRSLLNALVVTTKEEIDRLFLQIDDIEAALGKDKVQYRCCTEAGPGKHLLGCVYYAGPS